MPHMTPSLLLILFFLHNKQGSFFVYLYLKVILREKEEENGNKLVVQIEVTITLILSGTETFNCFSHLFRMQVFQDLTMGLDIIIQ